MLTSIPFAAGNALATYLSAVGPIIVGTAALMTWAYSIRNNRRASYVNSVTVTRLKWIGEVRDYLSRYVGLIYQCETAPNPDSVERQTSFQEIAHLRMLLRLQLAPEAAPLDADFERQIETVFAASVSGTEATIIPLLEELVDCGQRFLW